MGSILFGFLYRALSPHFFSAGGFTIVVLFSTFFSAGGFTIVVSFFSTFSTTGGAVLTRASQPAKTTLRVTNIEMVSVFITLVSPWHLASDAWRNARSASA